MDSTIANLLLDDLRVVCALTNRDLIITEVHGALRHFSPADQPCVGRSLYEVVPELVGSEKIIAQLLSNALPRYELGWVNRESESGDLQYLNFILLPYRNPQGRIIGLLHLMQDATLLGRLQQEIMQNHNELRLLKEKIVRQNMELAAANAELRRLAEVKSTFVSIAAHELRSPLASILGYLEMLIEGNMGAVNSEQAEALSITQGSAQRLLDITNSLLDLTRIESGRIDLLLTPVPLDIVVKIVVRELQPQIQKKSQQLLLETPANLPPALADQARAAQIVGNLVSNANKYTPPGGTISIRLSLAEEEGFLQLAVADTGIGIPPKDQHHLFDRFFRANNVCQTNATGVGLGLHLTRSLVELHGGRIWFQSELNKGSTFYVTFPLAEPFSST